MFLCPWQDELPLPDSAETEPELVDVSVQSNVFLGCMAIPVIFIQLSAGLHRWVEAWGFLGALHAGRHRAWSFQGPSSRSALAALMESVLWLQLKTFPRFCINHWRDLVFGDCDCFSLETWLIGSLDPKMYTSTQIYSSKVTQFKYIFKVKFAYFTPCCHVN